MIHCTTLSTKPCTTQSTGWVDGGEKQLPDNDNDKVLSVGEDKTARCSSLPAELTTSVVTLAGNMDKAKNNKKELCLGQDSYNLQKHLSEEIDKIFRCPNQMMRIISP